MLRLLLVEDDAVFRRGLREVWADGAEVCIVAECHTVQEAREALARGVQFEVGLVDLDLPDGSGLDVLREATIARKDAYLLVLTKFAGTDEVLEALRAGAVGYLLKHTPPRKIVESLAEAASGGAPMSPEIARKLVETFHPRALNSDDALTPREHQVLTLLCKGLRYDEVGAELQMAQGTVQTHVRQIYRKLRVTSKTEATRTAIRRGWIAP